MLEPGQVVIGDKGFAGAAFEQHVAALGGRTLTGLISCIARRLLALTAAILHNCQLNTTGRRLTAYDN